MNAIGNFHTGMGSPSRVQAYAGRTLDLLHAIEKTVDHLSENRDHIAVLAGGMVKTLQMLQNAKIETSIDPEGRVCDLLGQSLDALARMHASSARRRESAVADTRLRHDDGVVEAYDNFLSALNDAHEVVHELKEWIETHEALLDSPSGTTYSEVDDLFTAMGIVK